MEEEEEEEEEEGILVPGIHNPSSAVRRVKRASGRRGFFTGGVGRLLLLGEKEKARGKEEGRRESLPVLPFNPSSAIYRRRSSQVGEEREGKGGEIASLFLDSGMIDPFLLNNLKPSNAMCSRRCSLADGVCP